MPRVLAIETSCDETAAAVVEGDGQSVAATRSNVIASQVKLHAEYGGVYPDLAAREHVKNIIPTITLTLHQAGLLQGKDAQSAEVQAALGGFDAIAVTVGPGLIGSLLVGTNAAAMLAELSGLPIIPVNHWEGHLYSVFLQNTDGNRITDYGSLPQFPILFLTVSGGHTSLILMRDHFTYEVLGRTVDDAAGAAFDKCARLLGLGYPGGPALSKEAEKARQAMNGKGFAQNGATAGSLELPRPMLDSGDLNFSFSGLKTAVRYAIDRGEIDPNDPNSSAAAAKETEDAIVDVLLAKLVKAAKRHSPKTVAIVGGVSANKELRRRAQELFPHSSFLVPHPSFCTDNAAMIGAAGLFRFTRNVGIAHFPRVIEANASLRLT